MKWILCENNKSDSKYWQGVRCYEEIMVDDVSTKAWCWKCVARMVPVETPKPKSGYPRGWKFMTEFVDKDGNVYHKGELQPELFGTKTPTPIKESKKPDRKKKDDSFDSKVLKEIQKRLDKKQPGKTKSKTKESIVPTKTTKKTSNTKESIVPTKTTKKTSNTKTITGVGECIVDAGSTIIPKKKSPTVTKKVTTTKKAQKTASKTTVKKKSKKQ